MHTTRTTLVALIATLGAQAGLLSGCDASADKPGTMSGSLIDQVEQAEALQVPREAPERPTVAAGARALIEEVGIEPGALAPEPDATPEAVVVVHEGQVQVRRTGEEAFAAVPGEDMLPLFAGDQLQTDEGAGAELRMPDGSRVQVAELSAIAIGDRDAEAEPAASIAVLVGIAYFDITDRAPGEGPFLVFTPAGVANALGTLFAVGVSATGQVRVGVDEGSVEVAGEADFEKTAVLTASQAVDVSLSGEVATVAKLEDGWADWRAQAEANADVAALVEAQTQAALALQAPIASAQASLDLRIDDALRAEAEAEALEQAGDLAAYEAAAAARIARIEAPFAVSLRLQQLTFAMLAHAHVAHALHLRHPDKLGARAQADQLLTARAMLLHKRFHVAVGARMGKLRRGYLRQHPRGRAHAGALGVDAPAFAKAKLTALEALPKQIDGIALYRPRRPTKVDEKRKAMPRGVAHGWHKQLEHDMPKGAAPHALALAWYKRRDPQATASPLLHDTPARELPALFAKAEAKPRKQVLRAFYEQHDKPHKTHPGLHLGHEGHMDGDKHADPGATPGHARGHASHGQRGPDRAPGMANPKSEARPQPSMKPASSPKPDKQKPGKHAPPGKPEELAFPAHATPGAPAKAAVKAHGKSKAADKGKH